MIPRLLLSIMAPGVAAGVLMASGAAASQTAPAATPAQAAAADYIPFAAPSPPADIIATLTAGGRFTTLLKAIDAAGLTATLKQPGTHFTLFAPTDAAFAALPAGALDDLLKPENRTKLQHLLLYHLINATVLSSEVLGHEASNVPSGAGPALHLDGSSGAMTVNGAKVLQADIIASNGTVQVIDKALMPPS
jgi:uncharacterized surface protein with fasciclin (FAS1) repeats